MKVIDSHVHLYPPAVNRQPARWAVAHGESHWATLSCRRRPNGQPVQAFPSVGELLRTMDAAGVARAVLLGWYWENPATCVAQNRFYAQCRRSHPDRLAAFATFHPRAGRAATLEEVRRAHGEGLCGLGELSPHSQGYRLTDPVFAAALELAAQLELPVTLHVTDPDSGKYPGKVATPLRDFVRLARKFPETNFILAHWGGLLPLRYPDALGLSNVYYDTAASPLLYREDIWRRFLSVVPNDRVLFGSDYPLNVYPRIDAKPNLARLLAELHRTAATGEQLESVACLNAARIIRW